MVEVKFRNASKKDLAIYHQGKKHGAIKELKFFEKLVNEVSTSGKEFFILNKYITARLAELEK